MQSQLKHLVAFLVIAALGAALYYVAMRADFVGSAMVRAEDIEQETNEMHTQVAAQIEALRQLQLDDSIFSSKAFKELEDLSKPLEKPELSRPNPFERLPGIE